MQYQFSEIESKWQKYWEDSQTFRADENPNKEKFYILDMFPYPSGAGLHVGHPLGYIASDIIARYKRHSGFEVLHPMGFDAFGLPAEQYAIETGNHPEKFTDENIEKYRNQLKKIGLSFDWSREVKTSDPNYYKWTQWIFIQLFDSYYDNNLGKALPIQKLISHFEQYGTMNLNVCQTQILNFTSNSWNTYTEEEKSKTLLNYRMAYIGESEVNWCPELGTVLANEEVKDGVSERGGFPVVKKKMSQWFLRITAYADRLISDFKTKEWPDAIQEMQKNWIGKSVGAEIDFEVENSKTKIKVFTTRLDTIFGVSFMVLAPEHPLVLEITTDFLSTEVRNYIQETIKKTERDRLTEGKKVSGCFTGAFGIHPFTKLPIPIYIADYVLNGYGTGAIMAVPAHDSRDFEFAKHFGIPIPHVVEGGNLSEECFESKEGKMINSQFLNGLSVKEAIVLASKKVEELGIGLQKVNFKLRDANFSRQRYWGEPIPIYYKNGIPYTIPENELPVLLPIVESYKPTGEGESPLASVAEFMDYKGIGRRESNTMPGWAGSSWYFLRYMDAHNNQKFVSNEKQEYWQNVDFYLGGSEHATGHLLYSRFWQRFLYDRGFISTPIAFKKLINQGMIQGRSSLVYRVKGTNTFVSKGLKKNYETTEIHIDIKMVSNDILDIKAFQQWREDYSSAEFILEEGKYHCGYEVEKMSKRWYNVITPDEVIEQYGCDCFRMYEMFLGPIESSKPWSTDGIDGVSRFIKKFWNLFYSQNGEWLPSNQLKATEQDLKTINKTIKKIRDDISRFSLNTCVSTFMICVNDLTASKCRNEDILRQLVILISPFAPHLAEELYSKFVPNTSISRIEYPEAIAQYLIDSEVTYAIQINGKLRAELVIPKDTSKEEIEEKALLLTDIQKWLEGSSPKKIIVVPNKIVNIVI